MYVMFIFCFNSVFVEVFDAVVSGECDVFLIVDSLYRISQVTFARVNTHSFIQNIVGRYKVL